MVDSESCTNDGQKKSVSGNVAVEVDLASVNDSVQQILSSDWYKAAKDNPTLVANIMNQISERVVGDYHYNSHRH